MKDVHPAKLHTITGSTENDKLYDKQPTIIDSHIVNDIDINEVKTDFMHLLGIDAVTNNIPSTEDREPPDILLFPEKDWQYFKGKWIPPEQPSRATLHHLASTQTSPPQSDSGANRIVSHIIFRVKDIF